VSECIETVRQETDELHDDPERDADENGIRARLGEPSFDLGFLRADSIRRFHLRSEQYGIQPERP
jgi:hypothetical protein